MTSSPLRNERGVALILALFLALVVSGIAVGVIVMSSNATLISRFHAKEAMMQAAADAGLEQARDTLNGNGILMPITGYDTLSLNQPVRDAENLIIPGFTRSVYAGRSGITSGQFGVFASAISVISDVRGAVVVRRMQLDQQSFAKYAEFTDTFPSGLCVGYGNVKFGPVHSNTAYRLCSTGPAVFNGLLTTAATIINRSVGTYNQGYKEGVPRINMPAPASLTQLRTIALSGGYVIAGGSLSPTAYDPAVRIEFYPIDINGDGQFNGDNEGFIRVFQARTSGSPANNRAYVNARRWDPSTYPNPSAVTDPNLSSPNCGGPLWLGAVAPGVKTWITAEQIQALPIGGTARRDSTRLAFTRAGRRCYLGGDPAITLGVFAPAVAPYGDWVPYPGWGGGSPPAAVQNAKAMDGHVIGAVESQYLWPIGRFYNSSFAGVLYVDGSVAVSGNLRGQITLAATGNIMLDDDLTYVTAPSTTCDDMLGIVTPMGETMADNNVNSPFQVGPIAGWGGGYKGGFDDTDSEYFNGVFLALTTFSGENPTLGSSNAEPCNGNVQGRGCDIVVGGLVQRKAGATASTGGQGWNDQYTYDVCALKQAPPYFPTTGRYEKNRYYEIDPVGFTVQNWFALNQN